MPQSFDDNFLRPPYGTFVTTACAEKVSILLKIQPRSITPRINCADVGVCTPPLRPVGLKCGAKALIRAILLVYSQRAEPAMNLEIFAQTLPLTDLQTPQSGGFDARVAVLSNSVSDTQNMPRWNASGGSAAGPSEEATPTQASFSASLAAPVMDAGALNRLNKINTDLQATGFKIEAAKAAVMDLESSSSFERKRKHKDLTKPVVMEWVSIHTSVQAAIDELQEKYNNGENFTETQLENSAVPLKGLQKELNSLKTKPKTTSKKTTSQEQKNKKSVAILESREFSPLDIILWEYPTGTSSPPQPYKEWIPANLTW
jgi:hypothetical protein